MKNIFRIIPAIVLGFLFLAYTSQAEEFHFKSGTPAVKQTAAGCDAGANFKWLEINNVRTRINTGGDMWWDFEVAQYEIPKGSKKMSMFAAALWIGGFDANGQLKLAAQRFRQDGFDFTPGPLTIDGTASITSDICAEYDKLHYITRTEVDNFLAWFNDKESDPDYVLPYSIDKYPATNDDKDRSFYLAPFYDNDPDGEGPAEPDGEYHPREDGDYPYYDLTNVLCGTRTPTAEDIYYDKEQQGNLVDQVLKGDATLWWVFNDKGNIHTESKGEPIGLEIRGQAFGFSTNDEINNMTFYSYEIINRSTYELTQTYFSQWVDTDLGYAKDDYVGCDVMRGLGYCYNGTSVDGNGQSFAYGDQPPAIGVDFFQGPYIDPDTVTLYGDNPSINGDATWHKKGFPDQVWTGGALLVQWDGDTLEKITSSGNLYTIVNSAAINGINFGNGIENDERFGMRRFVYHNNGGPFYMQDPSVALEYYNFLRGIWKDGTKMVYGGNGHESAGAYIPLVECDFMFPGLSDIYDWGTKGVPVTGGPKEWTEVSAGNPPNDRRFMESAGPFILKPGAVNYITVGIPWARALSGGPQASVKLLQQVDDKCQQLFDNCFKVISGPNAPDLTIREMDQELILYISNRKTNDAGNNYQERYSEYDPRIQGPAAEHWDSLYRFEGYQIYQLKSATVSVADLRNTEEARLVYQCDAKNGVSRLVNFYFDQNLNGSVPIEEVIGANKGLSHSVKLTKDIFTGENLINHKQYYYLAIAYAYNNYKPYNQTEPSALDGQKLPYLAGRKNIKTYTGIPHTSVGLISASSSYGDGVVVTRIAGQGNGGRSLELSDESIAEILSKPMADSLTNLPGNPNYPIAYKPSYKAGKGPIDIKVIDPLNVKSGSYSVKFDSMYMIRVRVGERDTNMMTASWSLIDNVTSEIYKSDTSINTRNEQIFLDLGISVSIEQTLYPGPYVTSFNVDGDAQYSIQLPNNGFLGASITYQDSTKKWLDFVPDVDALAGFDWIKAGVTPDDWQVSLRYAFDPESAYEQILTNSGGGGIWAPYMLTESGMADTLVGVAHGEQQFPYISREKNYFTDLASVDIVFTADKAKWTRSAILEMSPDPLQSEGGARQFELRAGRSVNQDGNPEIVSSNPAMNSDFISPYGMGWFPGYAINVETGERLNIIFGEDSRLVSSNGRDMKFNPTSYRDNNFRSVVGGKHFIYIMGHVQDKRAINKIVTTLPDEVFDNPAYDGCANFVKQITTERLSVFMKQVRGLQMSNCMWTAIPLANQEEWLGNDVTIKLRVTKPYARYFSTKMSGLQDDNDYWPMYSFETEGLSTNLNDTEKATTDLDLINVVPNPYNAYSKYEVNQLDNRIKIVNLPQKCQVTIYATNGNIIRQFNKDETKTSIDWDLKNFAGIPISGGVYIIHVKSDQGEKVIKWFGSLRPVDLNAF